MRRRYNSPHTAERQRLAMAPLSKSSPLLLCAIPSSFPRLLEAGAIAARRPIYAMRVRQFREPTSSSPHACSRLPAAPGGDAEEVVGELFTRLRGATVGAHPHRATRATIEMPR